MRLPILLFCAALSFLPGFAQAQAAMSPPELDALIAPIALYPDDVVRLVLDASRAPAEIAEAGQWSRVNHGMTGDDAVRAVQAGDQGITVAPAMPYIYYVPYYDPLVVYGGWWWPAYRPVFWRPWRPSPVFVTNVVVVNRGFRGPAFAHRGNGNISAAASFQARNNAAFVARAQTAGRPVQFQNRIPSQSFHTEAFRRVPESQRQ